MRLFGFAVRMMFVRFVILFFLLGSSLPAIGGESRIIGVWDYSTGRESYKVIIAEEDDETILVKKFKDGIMIRKVVMGERRSDGMVYNVEDCNDEDEYYLVDQTGNLQIWGGGGFKETLNSAR